MPALVLIAAIGLAGGILSGLFGIGGGLVIVPGLIILAGFTAAKAAGTSLAALLLPVGLFGALEYYRAGQVDVRAAVIIASWSERSSVPASGRRSTRSWHSARSGSSCSSWACA